jgi:hypothetical protein
VTLPPPSPPPLPPPPLVLERRFAVLMTSAAFLLALAVAWGQKARRAGRSWLRSAWRAALAAIPGPYHFDLVLRDLSARLPRADLDVAATILGRAYSSEMQTRELDVRKTVRLTIRRGLLPQFVFKPRRMASPIIVLQDVSQAMDLWRRKVDAFLVDLRRQGIVLDRWYFDADPRRLAEKPFGTPARLDSVLRRRPLSPLLIISDGAGLPATLAAGDREWLRLLADRTRRAWLTPVADVRLWPDELRAIPTSVWPMTRSGLTQAARDFAGVGRPRDAHLRRGVLMEGQVSVAEGERGSRLASLVPYPTTELVELLRQRFAPDVSDAVVLHLLAESGSHSGPVVRLSEAELRRSAEAVRAETPRLEAAVRSMLLGVLKDSEPAPGSAAHLRWQAAQALHEVVLADLQGSNAASAIADLQTLAHGPLWEEVRSAARFVPRTTELQEQLDTAIGSRHGPPRAGEEDEGRLMALHPMAWSWPGPREIAAASLATLALFAGGCQLHLFPAHSLEHVQDAYTLDYVAGAANASAQLQVGPADASNDATLPRQVNLYQDTHVFGRPISLSSAGPASVPLTPGDTGKYYQVRASLPGGNLAVSKPMWVPSDALILVLIDAQPWARVAVKGPGVDLAPQPTPFTTALAPGPYHLSYENGGVTPSMEKDVTVTGTSREFRYPMPGFDAKSTAADLVRR